MHSMRIIHICMRASRVTCDMSSFFGGGRKSVNFDFAIPPPAALSRLAALTALSSFSSSESSFKAARESGTWKDMTFRDKGMAAFDEVVSEGGSLLHC